MVLSSDPKERQAMIQASITSRATRIPHTYCGVCYTVDTANNFEVVHYMETLETEVLCKECAHEQQHILIEEKDLPF